MKLTKLMVISIGVSILQLNSYAKDDESIEPRDQYVLIIDSKEFPIELNRAKKLSISISDPEVLLKVNQYKTFNYGGVFCKYPRHYTFEANLGNPKLKIWTLSGNDAKIIIQNYSVSLDHKYLADLLAKNYGKKNCKVENCKLTFTDKTLQGTKVLATIAGNIISQQVFSLPTKEGTTMLILQDSPSDDGGPSKEGIELNKLLNKYFKLKK